MGMFQTLHSGSFVISSELLLLCYLLHFAGLLKVTTIKFCFYSLPFRVLVLCIFPPRKTGNVVESYFARKVQCFSLC